MAKTLLEKWSNFETIFIASLILDIFSASTPLSAYLQTKSLNYQQAWSMIVTLKQQILKKRNDDKIEILYKKCKEFTKKINNFFESEPEIEVQEDFQNKRLTKKKKNYLDKNLQMM